MFIRLTGGKEAAVDLEDADLGEFNWQAKKDGHVYRANSISLHREIAKRIGLDIDGKEVDHKDLDPMNNRRSNLRAATHAENSRNKPRRRDNTSGHKGVRWNWRYRNKWQAVIVSAGVFRLVGRYQTREEAICAWEQAADELHGEFARMN